MKTTVVLILIVFCGQRHAEAGNVVGQERDSNLSLDDKLMDFLESEYLQFVLDNCFNSSESLQRASINATPWIWQKLDASAKSPSGILNANLVWMGSYECLSIHYLYNNSELPIQGKYCELEIPLRALNSTDERMKMMFQQIASKIYPGMPMSIYRGICIPTTCSVQELNSALHIIHAKNNSASRITGCNDKRLELDAAAIAVIVIWSVLAAILVAATVYDMSVQGYNWWITKLAIADSQIMSPNHKEGTLNKRGAVGNFIMVFSMCEHGKQLFSTKVGRNDLAPLHGIRFLTVLWVVLLHTYYIGSTHYKGWDNYSAFVTIYEKFFFQIVANGYRAVDTFFFLSGLLVAYGTLPKMKLMNGKLNLLRFYLHRYWRLIPPYAMVIAWVAGLSTLVFQGPLMGKMLNERDNCRANWWRNLLFINNFGDHTKMCMLHTWYLAVDFQLYILSPIILYPLYRKPYVGIGLLASLTAVSCITSGVVTYLEDLPAQQLVNQPGLKILEYFEDYYIMPYCRVGPYAIGMFVGYILQKSVKPTTLHPVKICICWCIAIGCNLAIVFGSYDHYQIGVKHSRISNVFFNSLSSTVWAASIGWITYACVRGCGGIVSKFISLKMWLPFSHLAYCIYLIHFAIEDGFYSSRKNKFHLDHQLMVTLFLGFLLMSLLVAVPFSIAFEMAMLKLEQFFTGSKNSESTIINGTTSQGLISEVPPIPIEQLVNV